MTEQDVFILADEALKRVVDQIRDDQWDVVVPAEMTPRLPGSILRTVINYHAYDDAWVPDVLAGKTIEEVGDAWKGDLLGDHPKLNFGSIVETAVLAVGRFDDLDRTVHLTYGDYPAREYLRHITSFRGCGRTTSRSSSVRTPVSRTISCRDSGTRSRLTPKSGARSASTDRRSRCRRGAAAATGCSVSPAAGRNSRRGCGRWPPLGLPAGRERRRTNDEGRGPRGPRP